MRLNGVNLISLERVRQIEMESFDVKHDDEHDDGELAWAAVCYAAPSKIKAEVFVTPDCGCREAGCGCVIFPKKAWSDPWPWDPKWDKRDGSLRDLIKAGALIAAEIDRRLRLGESIFNVGDKVKVLLIDKSIKRVGNVKEIKQHQELGPIHLVEFPSGNRNWFSIREIIREN